MNKTNYFKNGFLEEILSIKDFNEEKIWPKISIVMPSFNHSQYIERSILSVLNQGYPNLELIIIDGGSRWNSRNYKKIFKIYSLLDK